MNSMIKISYFTHLHWRILMGHLVVVPVLSIKLHSTWSIKLLYTTKLSHKQAKEYMESKTSKKKKKNRKRKRTGIHNQTNASCS